MNLSLLLVTLALLSVAASQRAHPELNSEFTTQIKTTYTSTSFPGSGHGMMAVSKSQLAMRQEMVLVFNVPGIPPSTQGTVQIGSCAYNHQKDPYNGDECDESHTSGTFFDDFIVPHNASFTGEKEVNGIACEVWVEEFPSSSGQGGTETTEFYVSQLSDSSYRPVRVVQAKMFQIDYHDYKQGTPAASLFVVPDSWDCDLDECSGGKPSPDLPKWVPYASANMTIHAPWGEVEAAIYMDMPNQRMLRKVSTFFGTSYDLYVDGCEYEYESGQCDVEIESFSDEFDLPWYTQWQRNDTVNDEAVEVWFDSDEDVTYFIKRTPDGSYPLRIVDDGVTRDYHDYDFSQPDASLFTVNPDWGCRSCPAHKLRKRPHKRQSRGFAHHLVRSIEKTITRLPLR